MNSNTLLKRLGDEVRRQGGQGSRPSVKDLVYDLEKGEFVQVDQTANVPATCEIVTEMTSEGFAAP